MKVLRLRAHNVLKIKDIDFNLQGHHLFLVGGDNGQGKTSVLMALRMALCGRSGADYPEVALRDGETEGWVKVDLGEDEKLNGLTVELYLKRGRGGNVAEKFRVLDANGREAPSPRTILDRLYQMRAFDPMAFERLDRKSKRAMLCKLVGLDFAESNKEHKEVYDERTDVNREATRLQAKLDGMPQHRDVEGVDRIDVEQLMGELESRQLINASNAKAQADATRAGEEIARRQTSEAELKRQIDELTARLAESAARTAAMIEEHGKLVDRVASLQSADVESIKEQIKTAGDTNRKIDANATRSAAEKELTGLRDKSQNLTDRLDAIKRRQQEALQNAQWPIPGLSIDDDGVLFNGLPIEQECTSMRTIISTKIGMALNPRLRLLVCQGGNDLGNDAMNALQKVLEENDFQMLLEVITRSQEDEARCAVVIEDGQQSVTDVPAEESA